MKELTPIQKKVFEFIESFINDNGFPPTYAEISDRFGFQVGMVQQVMRALLKKGKIEKDPFLARGIRLIKPEGPRMNSVPIPLYGNVAAGEPIFASDNVQGYMSLDLTRKISPEHLFALRIKGESMIDAGILEDDMVIVKKQHDADDGNIVVALVGDEATVKKLRKKRNKVYLEPANPKYKPIVKPFKVIGKVIEIRRRLVS
jgi:repressor LexA